VTTQRVADRAASLGSLAGLQSSAARLSALQSQLSSGRAITKPSDSPTGTVSALELRSQLKQVTQYQANAQDGIGWLTEIDSTLSSVTKATQTVRDLVLQGQNTATNDASSDDALAQQVDAIRSTLLGLANTSYEGRPVFGGTTAGTTAFDATGTYQGDTGTVTRTIGPNDSVQVGASGTAVFGANGSNLFDVLTSISNNLRTNPSGLSGDLTNLDAAMTTLSSQQALAGASYNRIQSVQTVASATSLQVTTQLSNIQDVDMADMAIQVSSANVSYQAALQVTANIRQTSLLDFLK
jgi:flagellar hook-associated protein 3 FlgL